MRHFSSWRNAIWVSLMPLPGAAGYCAASARQLGHYSAALYAQHLSMPPDASQITQIAAPGIAIKSAAADDADMIYLRDDIFIYGRRTPKANLISQITTNNSAGRFSSRRYMVFDRCARRASPSIPG